MRSTVAVGAAGRDAAAGKSAGVWANPCGPAQTRSHCAAFTATGRFAAALATGPVSRCVAGVVNFTALALFLFSVSAYFLFCFVNQLLLSDCEIDDSCCNGRDAAVGVPPQCDRICAALIVTRREVEVLATGLG